MPPYLSDEEIHEQNAREANKTNPRCIAVIQTTQLDLWLLRTAQVAIKAVPAFFCPTKAPIKETLMMIDGPDSALDATAEKLLIISTWVKEQLPMCGQRAIWRWNFCAPIELKHAMATHARPNLQSPLHSIDDPRFFDIAYQNYMCGLDDLSVCVRPWVEAAQLASYPVEFRCFVDASHETVTVTSYYPQRPLPEDWRPIAEATKPYALQLYPQKSALAPIFFSLPTMDSSSLKAVPASDPARTPVVSIRKPDWTPESSSPLSRDPRRIKIAKGVPTSQHRHNRNEPIPCGGTHVWTYPIN